MPTASSGINPYIDSLSALGSPSPMLEKNNRHKYLDPNQDCFGQTNKTDERFNREKKH